MQDLCVCITLSIKHPKITDMVGPPSSKNGMSTDSNEQHACAIGTASASIDVNAGLLSFQIVPADVMAEKSLTTGEVLLNHVCLYQDQTSGADPSVHIDLAIGELQMEVVDPTAEDMARCRLLQDVAMDSRKKMSTRKLNN